MRKVNYEFSSAAICFSKKFANSLPSSAEGKSSAVAFNERRKSSTWECAIHREGKRSRYCSSCKFQCSNYAFRVNESVCFVINFLCSFSSLRLKHFPIANVNNLNSYLSSRRLHLERDFFSHLPVRLFFVQTRWFSSGAKSMSPIIVLPSAIFLASRCLVMSDVKMLWSAHKTASAAIISSKSTEKQQVQVDSNAPDCLSVEHHLIHI